MQIHFNTLTSPYNRLFRHRIHQLTSQTTSETSEPIPFSIILKHQENNKSGIASTVLTNEGDTLVYLQEPNPISNCRNFSGSVGVDEYGTVY